MKTVETSEAAGLVAGSTVDPADELVRARAQVGDFELIVCTDGTYRLDGGADVRRGAEDALAEARSGG